MNMTSKPLSRPQLPLNEKTDLVQKWLDSCCSPWNFSSAQAHKITSFQRGLLSWLGWHIIDLYNEGTFLALIFKTDWPPKCSLLLMWIAWSPNLLVMSTYITVKAAANPIPFRLPTGSPGGQVTKLLAHSGNSNCVSCFHQTKHWGPSRHFTQQLLHCEEMFVLTQRNLWLRTATDIPVQVSLWSRGTAPLRDKVAEITTLLSAKP